VFLGRGIEEGVLRVNGGEDGMQGGYVDEEEGRGWEDQRGNDTIIEKVVHAEWTPTSGRCRHGLGTGTLRSCTPWFPLPLVWPKVLGARDPS
jgi:hypothetical protein